MSQSQAPIGVFDSGVGGLSVLREIRQLLPNETLLYVADSGHVPYGEKSPEYIRERCVLITEHLLAQGAKALVLACNTATAAAAAELRERYPDLPIVGMEPAVKPAAAATRTTGCAHDHPAAATTSASGAAEVASAGPRVVIAITATTA